MHTAVDDFVCALEGVRDTGSLGRVLGATLGDLGFNRFTYLSVRRPALMDSTLYISTYPKAWTDHYRNHHYLDLDPVMLHASRGLIPFQWRGQHVRRRATRQQIRVFDEANAFDIRDGITVPIHGMGGEFAVLSATPDMSNREFDRHFAEVRHIVHLVALHCHAAVDRLLRARGGRRLPTLSHRERECLLWTARGKTAWEIGEILGISESTVVSHLNACKRKLGVYGKHHAVVRAIMTGLLVP